RLQVLQEPPVTGREANRDAWNGYLTAFPDYVIYPDRLVHHGDDVLVLGSTTGSHLGLSDQDERQLKVIWRATVRDGLLTLWQVLERVTGSTVVNGAEAMPVDDVNGVELYWERRGSGPRLLFCNGSGTTLQVVRPLLDSVAGRFDLLAWDYRGLGRSVP